MFRHFTAYGLMVLIVLLLGGWAVVDAASKKRDRQESRTMEPVLATETRATGGERRVALVIGNAAYDDALLKNPANDANDIAAAFRQIGFEVTALTNARLRQMDEATEAFGKQLRRSDVGVFFYAGHGIQVAGENYLVPIGARIHREQDVKFEAYHVGRLLGIMEDAGNTLNLIILDACRNNPFARAFRSSQPGLAVAQAIPGALIAYATAPGAVASDGAGRNGIYTSHLLRHLRTPGLPVEEMFKQVRISVRQDTAQRQTPWESSSLTRSFSFTAADETSPQGPSVAITAPRPHAQEPVTPSPPPESAPRHKAKDSAETALLPFQPQDPPIQASPRPPAARPKVSGKSLVNSLHMEFVLVPPGEFTMGAEGTGWRPAHRVVISRPFYMGKHEVTQAQWVEIMGNNPSIFKGTGEKHVSAPIQNAGGYGKQPGGSHDTRKSVKLDPNRPVEMVSWHDIQVFIQRLNNKEGHARYRLPTEAEWEYAARAGSSWNGLARDQLNQHAWCAPQASGTTHEVGQLQPNAWGLHDMFGNVFEWVNDWWGVYQPGAVADPQGPPKGTVRVYRGGAWNQGPAACQPAYRNYDTPAFKYPSIGFRLARETP